MESQTTSAMRYVANTHAKPWGHEVVFAVVPDKYVGKIIHVKAGQSLSCQYHVKKHETITLLRGEALVEHGATPDNLRSDRFSPGDTIHLPAGVVHRIEAVTDTVLIECSTAWKGWEHDVVRLKDAYGREGTSSP